MTTSKINTQIKLQEAATELNIAHLSVNLPLITQDDIEIYGIDAEGLEITSAVTEIWSNENHKAVGAVLQGVIFNTTQGYVSVAYGKYEDHQEYYEGFTFAQVVADVKQFHAENNKPMDIAAMNRRAMGIAA